MRIAAVVMVFFRLQQGKIFLATIDIVAPVSNTPRDSRPPSNTYPKHQVLGAAGASPSELRGTGHLEPLVPQFAGHPHETAPLLSVAIITTFMLTLGALFLLGLRL